MQGPDSGAAPRFDHRWATRICRDSPWYRRSANRVIEVTVGNGEIRSRLMFPLLGLGFSDVRIPIENVVGIDRTTYALPGLGFRIPTVTVEYRDTAGKTRSIEHLFTTLGPFSLVTTPSRRAEDFITAIEASRGQSPVAAQAAI